MAKSLLGRRKSNYGNNFVISRYEDQDQEHKQEKEVWANVQWETVVRGCSHSRKNEK